MQAKTDRVFRGNDCLEKTCDNQKAVGAYRVSCRFGFEEGLVKVFSASQRSQGLRICRRMCLLLV